MIDVFLCWNIKEWVKQRPVRDYIGENTYYCKYIQENYRKQVVYIHLKAVIELTESRVAVIEDYRSKINAKKKRADENVVEKYVNIECN